MPPWCSSPSVTELTSTLLLSPIGTYTLATEFWRNASDVAYGAAAPYAVLMVLISGPATLLLTAGGAAMTALSVRGVTKSYGPTPVLRGIDLEVPERSLTTVLGPSGCGKTTLLRLVAGFDAPDAGTIDFGERTVVAAGHAASPRSTAGSDTCPRRVRSSRTST